MRSLLAVILFFAPVDASKELEFKVTPEVANTFQYLYSYMPVEFAFCAYGKKRGNVITVNRVTLPVITSASRQNIWYRAETCPKKDLLGIGHSHPAPAECDLSRTDVYSFLTGTFEYTFLVCPNNEMNAYAKKEVRAQLLERGLLAEALTSPWK